MSKYSAEEVWDMLKDTFYMTHAERLDCFDTTYMGDLFSNFTIDGAMSTYNMWKEKQKPKYEIGDILLLDMDDGSCAEGIYIGKFKSLPGFNEADVALLKDKRRFSIANDEVVEVKGRIDFKGFFEE